MSEADAIAMLFVLAAALAGAGIAAAHFFWREGRKPMPLYEVRRTDAVQPGEFDNALVIAGGAAQARGAVAHLLKPGQRVSAERMDVSGPRGGGGIRLLSTYFDEREPLTQPDEFGTISLYGADGIDLPETVTTPDYYA